MDVVWVRLILAVWLLRGVGGTVSLPPAAVERPAVAVLADPADPYYPLAEEIAAAEDAPLVATIAEAWERRPAFLLWVVAPERLSDAVMVEWGQAARGQPDSIALGFLSSSTITGTRALWLRAREVTGTPYLAVNAYFPAAGVTEGRILTFGEAGVITGSLTVESLRQALPRAGYLTYTGHGANGYWLLDEDEEMHFSSAEIPALPAAVYSSAGCQTFRPWREGSIARAFVDQGAAAYTGFVQSPNEGYLIGSFRDLPFRYTWQEFPIGAVVQVQNHGLQQGVTAFPYYHLLGDPRIALQAGPPYRAAGEREENGVRVLSYAGAPAGAIPVRIPGGAAYRFVEIPGVTAAGMDDPFYNSRLQMADIGADKYVLFIHSGGDFELRLRERPPLGWALGDRVLDVLDYTLIFLFSYDGSVIALIAGGLGLLIALVYGFRTRASLRLWLWALPPALGAAAFQGVYALVRSPHVTVISKPMAFEPVGLLGTALMAGSATFLALTARSWKMRALTLPIAVALNLAGGIFGIVGLAVINGFAYRELGATIWNFNVGLLPLFGAALGGLVWTPVLWGWKRLYFRAPLAASRENTEKISPA